MVFIKTAISIIFLGLTALGGEGFAQQKKSLDNEEPRIKKSINDNWEFRFDKSDSGDWKEIDLPHTWNDENAFDEEPGYRRTVAWYQKELDIDPEPGKKYVLFFESANQTADVYINGKHAAKHKGGYTAFYVDATPYLHEDKSNKIRVKVDNRHHENIPPLKGDFNFYGGIYRDVWLLELNDTHFAFGDYESAGIVWYPDESYEQGFWGYKGGERFMPRSRGIGTPQDIKGTQRDPLFQTQRVNPDQYLLDIPKGTYEVTFLMADIRAERSRFDILTNDEPVITDFRLEGISDPVAIKKSFIMENNGDSVSISFDSKSGQAVVNGIGIRKVK